MTVTSRGQRSVTNHRPPDRSLDSFSGYVIDYGKGTTVATLNKKGDVHVYPYWPTVLGTELFHLVEKNDMNFL